jgi:hypothetical protein
MITNEIDKFDAIMSKEFNHSCTPQCPNPCPASALKWDATARQNSNT